MHLLRPFDRMTGGWNWAIPSPDLPPLRRDAIGQRGPDGRTELQRMIQMAEHKHGEMNTEVQEKTFEGFVKFTVWSVVVIIGILLFLALVNA
jgi:hypothetical protein